MTGVSCLWWLTNDKVYLLSIGEMINPSYELCEDYNTCYCNLQGKGNGKESWKGKESHHHSSLYRRHEQGSKGKDKN